MEDRKYGDKSKEKTWYVDNSKYVRENKLTHISNVNGLNLSVKIEMVSLKKISFMLFKRDIKHNTALTKM